MLISLGTPCMNRTYDLKKVMSSRLESAAASPPAEIVIINYQSKDDLDDYIHTLEMPDGVGLIYRRYTGKHTTYYTAHAVNLAVMSGNGDYIGYIDADAYVHPEYVQTIRKLAEAGNVYIRGRTYRNMFIIQRQAFIDAGGYDERFELYGPEDKDFQARMSRRGIPVTEYDDKYVWNIPTPKHRKRLNYKGQYSSDMMAKMMYPIFEMNNYYEILVANEGKKWAQWD